MSKISKKIIIFIFIITAAFAAAHFAVAAVDTGLAYGEATGLSAADPRIVAANVIRIVLGFLGIIALSLVIYAGWLWMSASGNEENIEKAKKILLGAVIGLLIIFSAFGIVTFVMNKFIGATGGDIGDGGNGDGGGGMGTGSYAASFYISSTDPNDKETEVFRNSLIRVYFNRQIKNADLHSLSTLKVEKIANLNVDPATGTTSEQTIIPIQVAGNLATSSDNNAIIFTASSSCVSASTTIANCFDAWSKYRITLNSGSGIVSIYNQNLECTSKPCVFEFSTSNSIDDGSPVISSVAPVGGFCRDGSGTASNTPCLADTDCKAVASSSTCDFVTANGAAGNFITLTGNHFGTTTGSVYFSNNGQWVQAQLADNSTTGNALCTGSVWQDKQVVAVLPPGLSLLASSTIKLVASGFEETTRDSHGPKINFIVNNIERPGLCKLDPLTGAINNDVSYYGIRLAGGKAYFGNFYNKVEAANSSFQGDKQGTAGVPNIYSGTTTSFILKNKASSNFLQFKKDEEPYAGPIITSFDPAGGKKGQYVTIRGSGFGTLKGIGKVYFGDENGVQASFDFPEACKDSIWSDKQIIVKVPDTIANGDYKITIKAGNWPAVDTGNLSPSTFKVDQNLFLKPSLCKIDPMVGQNNEEISLWGEYFGDKNSGKIRFQLNKDQSGSAIGYWGKEASIAGKEADKATTTIHSQAISGPVRMVQGGDIGNGINLKIGECKAGSDDCGNDALCCPEGSPEKGRCKAFEKDASGKVVADTVADLCISKTRSCVYEFEFSTGVDPVGQPCDNDPNTLACDLNPDKCKENFGNNYFCDQSSNCTCQKATSTCEKNIDCDQSEVCNLTTHTCTPPSCSGYGASQCSGSGLCPNVPGQCSTATTTTAGSCDCNYLYGSKCGDSSCAYDGINNACKKINSSGGDIACSIYESGAISGFAPGTKTPQCVKVGGQNKWQIEKGGGSCPDNTFIDINGNCTLGAVSAPAMCSALCDTGFTCVKSGSAADNAGICLIGQNLCVNGSVCDENSKICTYQNGNQPLSCSCCCRKANQNQDCCAGLSCTGTCGSNTDPAGGEYGKCSGCTKYGATGAIDYAASDAACNCLGHSGQYCDTSVAGGVCTDCTQLSNSGECSKHEASCCVDAKSNNACRGGLGDKSLDANGGLIAYCPYYNCGLSDATKCNNTASTTGSYSSKAECSSGCHNNITPGTSCNIGTSTPLCDPDSCSENNQCLKDNSATDACGICCCNPNDASISPPKTVSDGTILKCTENQTPCDGNNRGLYCGCKTDSQCAEIEGVNTGCSLDGCCRARPKIDLASPSGEGICRNALITATFDQAMDITSFTGNVIVVGEYGNSQCPPDTQYLTAKKEYTGPLAVRLADRIVDILARMPVLNRILFGEDVMAITGGNYCAISGTVSGKSKGLAFTPSKILDANRTYYVIIKGDKDVDDGKSEGILSSFKIGMKDVIPGLERKFNGIDYYGYSWNFKTKAVTADHQGVCLLNSVSMDPDSYLFKSSQNNTDDDSYGPDYDSNNNDSDKVFRAQAFSTDGQQIASIPGVYSWNWNWKIYDESVIKLAADGKQPPLASAKNVEAQNVKDARTILEAKVKITDDTINNPSTKDQEKSTQADIYVFLCENPWPAIKADGTWDPWKDSNANCKPETGACYDYNHEIYYCRDAGGDGTADDLPAIYSGDQVVIGSSSKANILKEYYLMRE